MQAKDINDFLLLNYIDRRQHELIHNFPTNLTRYMETRDPTWLPWVCYWDIETPWSEFPHKVLNAKFAKLIKRGLMSGCTCGCRGDFMLTEKGREAISYVPLEAKRASAELTQ